MKYVPHWVIDALMSKKFKCHSCKKVFTHKNVRALGIRDSVNESHKETFFIQLDCVSCGKTTFFEMQEMNIIELSEQVIKEVDADLEELAATMDELRENDMFQDEIIDSKKPSEKKSKCIPNKKENSKITLKDVREVKKVLKPEQLEHESFLEMMGMPPEEIFQYGEIE